MWNNRYVHTHFAGAPDDFVKAISQATWVVTNSFHGLMMATVFRKDVRLVRSSLAWRAQMSARVEEFAKSALSESIICNSLTEAFLSMNRHISYNEGWIEMRRKQSAEWLTEAIRNAVSSKGRK
jgi:hypothetical protein